VTRSVLDTNILVRAAITPLGAVAPVILRLRNGKFTLLYSQALLNELIKVLEYPHIQRKYDIDAEAIQNFVGVLVQYGERVEPNRTVNVCRDPDDNHVIEVALAGNAEYVVSNDQDLLVLKEYETVRFVTVGEFLRILDAQPSQSELSEQSE